ncbi:MAG: hypothetical protein WC408_06830, partial [Candidatus Micrarchaeia archaeon]
GGVYLTYSNGSSRTIPDFCSDSSVVFDMYCTGASTFASSGYVCPIGCSNGACVNTTTQIPSGCNYNNPSCPTGYTCTNNYCVAPIATPSASCQWVSAPCSYYGAVWSSPAVECTAATNGTFAMVGSSGYRAESYTNEHWNSCFTQRAQCICTASVNYAPPSPHMGFVIVNTKPWWCFWCN